MGNFALNCNTKMKINPDNVPGILLIPLFLFIIMPIFLFGLLVFLFFGAEKASKVMYYIDNLLSK